MIVKMKVKVGKCWWKMSVIYKFVKVAFLLLLLNKSVFCPSKKEAKGGNWGQIIKDRSERTTAFCFLCYYWV